MEEKTTFQNMDSWGGGGSNQFGLTFTQIVLMHINRCVLNGSVEMHGGYWNTTGHNPSTQIYVHNSRDVYVNSITMLRAILLGYFDKKMTEIDKTLKEAWDKLFKEKFKEKTSDDKESLRNYREEKMSYYIRLFEELIMLSKRLNFFEENVAETEP